MRKIILKLRQLIELTKHVLKYWISKSKNAESINDICEIHFQTWSSADHINRTGLTIALNEIPNLKPVIFETGTSAYGVDSSRLFDQVVSRNSGQFISVDINPQPRRTLLFQHSRRSKFYVDDSVNFIQNSLGNLVSRIDLAYLDSWDVDWKDPLPSAEHGLREFQEVRKYLHSGSILVIDDTPSSLEYIPVANRDIAIKFCDKYGVLPGKGSFVMSQLKREDFAKILSHNYNLVLQMY